MQKKISISIDSEVLQKVGSLVDGRTIKKLSHAFEFIIKEYLKGMMIDCLVILGGGKNIKMDGKIVAENVKKLMNFGVKEVFIIGGKNIGGLQNRLSKLGAKIHIINEESPKGTAGALKLVEEKIGKAFFCIFINIKFDFNVNEMIKLHKQNNSIATIGVTLGRSNTIPDNIIVEGSRVIAYNKTKNLFTNAGIYIFEPDVFKYMPKIGTLDKNVFPTLANEGKLFSYIITENWEYLGRG